MNCTYCGAALPEGADRCPICGRPAGAAAPPEPPDGPEGAAFFRDLLDNAAPAEPPPAPPAGGAEPAEPEAPETQAPESADPAPPPAPRRRRWPILAGAALAVLAVAGALLIRYVLTGTSQPVFYLTEEGLWYLYSPASAPVRLLAEVEGAGIAATEDPGLVYLFAPAGDRTALYQARLSRGSAQVEQVDTGFDLGEVHIQPGKASLLHTSGFRTDSQGTAYYLRRQGQSAAPGLYRFDGGAPQLLAEGADSFSLSQDGSHLLVRQDGSGSSPHRLIRLDSTPGGAEELVCEGAIAWWRAPEASPDCSTVCYTCQTPSGSGAQFYCWTAGEGSRLLAEDVSHLVRMERPEDFYYVKSSGAAGVLQEAGQPSLSSSSSALHILPQEALYHHLDGTDTLLCENLAGAAFMDELIVCVQYQSLVRDTDPPQAAGLELGLVVLDGGQPVLTLPGCEVWSYQDGRLYVLEPDHTLVRYTRAAGFADRTELAQDVYGVSAAGFVRCSGDGHWLCRIEGDRITPVEGAGPEVSRYEYFQDGTAVAYTERADMTYTAVCIDSQGSRFDLGPVKPGPRQLEGSRLLLLTEEGGGAGSLCLQEGERRTVLAEGVSDFCAPGLEAPVPFTNAESATVSS